MIRSSRAIRRPGGHGHRPCPGQIAPSACPGDRRWIQDYYDAMVLMPRNTTMIQARDAMLAADLARFGGANEDLLWQGFAMRGFGQYQNTVNNADTNPVPDFSSPLAKNATLNFFADTNDKGASVPVKAKIYVGDYEARSTPIADTDPATITDGTNATGNLDDTAQFVPTGPNSLAVGKRWSAYNFVAVAPGYGFVRFKVPNLQPGQTRNIAIHFATNYASTPGRHDHRGHARNEHGPREPHRRHRVDERRTDGRAGRGALGRRRPWHHEACASRQPRRLGAARAGQQPVHGAALVRCLRVHGRQAGQPDMRRHDRRGLDEDRAVTGQRVPVRQSAAGNSGYDAALLRRQRRTAGNAREVRRENEPVHGSGVVPRRPGQRSDQQRRLSRQRACERGARDRIAGVQRHGDGRRLGAKTN